jgi:hypothetical protein
MASRIALERPPRTSHASPTVTMSDCRDEGDGCSYRGGQQVSVSSLELLG